MLNRNISGTKRSIELERNSLLMKTSKQAPSKNNTLFTNQSNLSIKSHYYKRKIPQPIQKTPLFSKNQEKDNVLQKNFRHLKGILSPQKDHIRNFKSNTPQNCSLRELNIISRERLNSPPAQKEPMGYRYNNTENNDFCTLKSKMPNPVLKQTQKPLKNTPFEQQTEVSFSSIGNIEAHHQNPLSEIPNVRMTASFNIISTDVIQEYENQVDRTVNKLKKIFSSTSSVFNKQQLALILQNLGWVDELDDDYNCKSSEDSMFLSFVYCTLNSKNGGVKLKTLKKSLALLHALNVNKIFVRSLKEKGLKSPIDQKTSLSNKQQNVSYQGHLGSNDTNKIRINEQEQKRSGILENDINPDGIANMTIEEIFSEKNSGDIEIQFSFKKPQNDKNLRRSEEFERKSD